MSKDTLITKEKQRVIEDQNSDQSFIGRNLFLKIFLMWILYPIASIYSGLTEGTHLFVRFDSTFNSVAAAVLITILLIVAIEGGKYFFGTSFLQDIRKGVFSEARHYQIAFIFKGLGVLACFGFSLVLSIKGSPEVASFYKKQSSPIVLISTDSIHQVYDKKIAAQDTIINNASSKMTWKGNITRGGQKVISEAQITKNKLEDQRDVEITKAEDKNALLISDYENNIAVTGKWYQGITGLGELLALLCLLFLGNYKSGAEDENKVTPTTPSTAPHSQPAVDLNQLISLIHRSSSPTPSNPIITSTKPNAPIGFPIPDKKNDGQSMRNDIETSELGFDRLKAKTIVEQSLNGPNGTKVIDKKYLTSWMKGAYKRSMSNKTEDSRNYQRCLYEELRGILEDQCDMSITENDGVLDIVD